MYICVSWVMENVVGDLWRVEWKFGDREGGGIGRLILWPHLGASYTTFAFFVVED